MHLRSVMADEGRRVLGRTTAMMLTAAMIIGTGLFAALGETVEKAGAGVLIAIPLSGLIALATGLSAASVGVRQPEEGGGFIWSRRFGYPRVGFVAGCAYLGKGIVSTVVISLAFAAYTARMVDGLPGYALHVVAASAVALVVIANYFKIEVNAKLAIVLLLVELVLLTIFVGGSAHAIRLSNMKPVFEHGATGILAGAAIFVWTWDGFMRMAIMADEVKDPKRTIPFAVIGGITFAAVVFFVVGAVALGVLGGEMARKDSPNDTQLITAGVATMGRFGLWIVLAAAWLDTLTEAHGDLMVVVRVAHAMGEERELPRWIGALHKRFKTPHHALIAIGVICSVLALVIDMRRVLELANVFTIVWYSIVNLDAIKLKASQRLIPVWVSWLGLVACIAVFAALPIWAITTGVALLALALLARTIIRSELRGHVLSGH